jgi:hypothetical protein
MFPFLYRGKFLFLIQESSQFSGSQAPNAHIIINLIFISSVKASTLLESWAPVLVPLAYLGTSACSLGKVGRMLCLAECRLQNASCCLLLGLFFGPRGQKIAWPNSIHNHTSLLPKMVPNVHSKQIVRPLFAFLTFFMFFFYS